ncbi:hypothetical protein ZYGR_0AD03640 [Zygosaccharomyces rouxii]|uniref:ZYRO0G14564p n=2 Tax=Zygosaccharomyces rouxii TaxID=4956 RepID=C5E0P6_ZYGRC|nr:uncharacterized protein ZYRO0G14564g [Zygosaccharomyces rouxii]KAH9202674.1 hypothetical protein LQ764DRAFT_36425 [Zygosaccharomyces rouxii]GAV51181.1 hypothetical protein ZYGR_0AD03640 [Zygosaccharomyces rouxii]CAR29680.1 ZYRO0G14564p [Zygosaccharomyces rouxii]
MEMVNSDSSGTTNTTPKRDTTKRSSTEYMRAMASPSTATRANDGGSPETPSPPYHARRSSTSLGFLTSPLHPRAEAILSKNDVSPSGPSGDGGNNGLLMPHSPGMTRSRLMPPTTPKSRNAEVFLSPPPKLKSPSVYKDNGKPIREISNSLKARLNYALVKLQNGWVDKTLPELEHKLDEPTSSEQQQQQHRIPDQSSSSIHLRPSGYRGSYHNEYAADNDSSYLSSHSDEEGDNGNSAHSAFLKALSSPKRRKNNNEAPPTSPLNWSAKGERLKSQSPTNRKPQPPQLKPLKVPRQSQQPKTKQQPPSEVEAIETLMSLSSPQRSHSLQEFNLPAPPSSSRHQSRSGQPSSSRRQSSSGQLSSPTTSSSSSEKSNNDKLSNPLVPTHSQAEAQKPTQTQNQVQNRLVRPLIVPSLQRSPSMSDLSPESSGSDKSNHNDSNGYLHYSQQQTDIETDVEDSDDGNV